MKNEIKKFIDAHSKIVVVQADNPDGDSLASALALEEILSDAGKQVTLFCAVGMPDYLKYIKGWDRVVNELPTKFDASIIVDASAINLLEGLSRSKKLSWLSSKPCLVIDHHQTEPTIPFISLNYQKPAVSTGELIYELFSGLGTKINGQAKKLIVISIMSDSLGLISEQTTPKSIRLIADLVESGVSLAGIDSERRQLQRKSPEILSYKGELLKRVSYSDDQKIAFITIPWEEIEKYSHAYNPSVLVLDEMRQVESVVLAVAFKTYPDGKITAKIRSNYGFPIAGQLAEHFGGGGHPYASGFKITGKRSLDDVKAETIKVTNGLINKL